jgi:hypothetical protein
MGCPLPLPVEATNYHIEMRSQIVKCRLPSDFQPHVNHEFVIVTDNRSTRSVLVGKALRAKHEELRHYSIDIQHTHSSHDLTNTRGVTAAGSHE